MKNREIIENIWKILPGDGNQKREVSSQNGRVGISVVGEPHNKLFSSKAMLLTYEFVEGVVWRGDPLDLGAYHLLLVARQFLKSSVDQELVALTDDLLAHVG